MLTRKIPGEAVRKLRQLKGMKQQQACLLLDISQQAYSKLEQREMLRPSSVQKILIAFNSSLEELIDLCPPPRKMNNPLLP